MRRPTPSEHERTSGQLFLFDPPEREPDLDEMFGRLNARFFEGQLSARVEWSKRMTAVAGTCRPKDALIRVSVSYWRRRPDSLEATLAHEMVHLVAPGHGTEFQRIARPIADALGVTWREFRYAERWVDLSRYRYLYTCPKCGLEFPSAKRRRASCGRCAPRGYDEEYRLVLEESRARPGPVLLGERPVRAP